MLTLPWSQVTQPVQELPRGSFIILGLVMGQAPKAIPFQNDQLAASPFLLFLLFWSRFVLFLLWSALLVIVVVQVIKQNPCQFL